MTIRTAHNADVIVTGLSEGVPLRQLCRDLRIAWSAVYAWMADDAELAARIAQARESGHDAIAEDCLHIVDDREADPDAQSRKVRAETRLKLLAKWDPKRYGDKVETTVVMDADTADAFAAARKRAQGE